MKKIVLYFLLLFSAISNAQISVTGFSPSLINYSTDPPIVTINGTNLNAVTSVYVGSISATYTIISNTLITTTLPSNVASGNIIIYDGTTFSVSTSTLTIVGPFLMCNSSAVSSGTITAGANWQSSSVLGGSAYFWKFNATNSIKYSFSTCPSNASNTQLKIYNSNFSLITSSAYDYYYTHCYSSYKGYLDFVCSATGVYYVLLTDNYCDGLNSSGVLEYGINQFTVPTITGVTPLQGRKNSYVSITGSNLYPVTNLKFNGSTAYYSYYSTNLIVAQVPSNATTGPVSGSFSGGNLNFAQNFTITGAATVSGVAPSIISTPGTVFTINGSNLSGITAVYLGYQGSNNFQVLSSNVILVTITSSISSFDYIKLFYGPNYNDYDYIYLDNTVYVSGPITFCSDNKIDNGSITFGNDIKTVTGAFNTSPYWKFYATQGQLYQFNYCNSSYYGVDIRIYPEISTSSNYQTISSSTKCAISKSTTSWLCETSGYYYVTLSEYCSSLSYSTKLLYKLGKGSTITSISPTSGPGNSVITIKGTNLTNLGNLYLKNIDSYSYTSQMPDFKILNDTTVLAVIPSVSTSSSSYSSNLYNIELTYSGNIVSNSSSYSSYYISDQVFTITGSSYDCYPGLNSNCYNYYYYTSSPYYFNSIELNDMIYDNISCGTYTNIVSPLDHTTSLAQDKSYDLSFTNSTAMYVSVWIDLNNNGDFSSGEFLYSSKFAVRYDTVSIKLPSKLSYYGQTKMRIIGTADKALSATDFCYGYNSYTSSYDHYGQYFDFTVNLTDGAVTPIITEQIRPSYIKLYPNPSNSENITVETTGHSGSLQVSNELGEIKYIQNIIAGKNTVDVSSLTSGVYIFKFTTLQGDVSISKFVKQ